MSKRNVTLLIVFLVVILAFGYLFNFRSRQRSFKYDRTITELQTELVKQKIFSPVYARLLEDSKLHVPKNLPMPERAPLPREKIAGLPEVYQSLSETTNTNFQVVVPDITFLGRDSNWLRLDVLLRGDFFDLRDYLLKLGELPYLEHIEQVRIQTTQAAKECTIKMWLSVAEGQD